MKSKIAGMSIWEVAVRHDYVPDPRSRVTTTLWITGPWDSALGKVFEKTKKFLSRNASEYPHPEIKSVTSRGHIDA